jgi:hypothetical protein
MTESQRAPDKPPEPRRPKSGPAAPQEQPQSRREQQLDEALADSFPASDPVSIVTSQQEEDPAPPESN